jgi:hypothetical protein
MIDLMLYYVYLNLFIYLFIFGHAGDWTQELIQARQALYQW